MKPIHAAALSGFDSLPASAGVRVPVVAAVFGVSVPTVWRWSKQNLIPSPSKRGGVTCWNVGDLRRAMKAEPARERSGGAE